MHVGVGDVGIGYLDATSLGRPRITDHSIEFFNLAITQLADLGVEAKRHDATKDLRLVGLEHGAIAQVLVIEFPHQELDVLMDLGRCLE